MLEMDDESKIIKKLLVIEEICSWLSPGLDGQKVCSQEHALGCFLETVYPPYLVKHSSN